MEFLIFVTLSLWFYLLFSVVTKKRRRVSERLQTFVLEEAPKPRSSEKKRFRAWHRMMAPLAKRWISSWPRKRLEKVQLRLLRAHSRWTVGEWIALQLFSLAGGLVVAFLILIFSGLKVEPIAMALALVLLSWIGPDFWLSKQISKRQLTLRRQLPSTLDLLTVSVEAGLGFDQAMSRVSEELSGPMAEEMQRIIHEMQLGTPRLQALQRFARRTGVDVIELFVSAVVQADKLGIGMTRVLRIQADEVRRKQRAAAQEQAAKAPIKILFPLILFIFPALFVVILGPAVLHIIQAFSHTAI